jgi:hypothetical protein
MIRFFFFLVVLGFEPRASSVLSRSLPLEPLCQLFFVLGIFEIGFRELFAQGWPQTEMRGMSHWFLATFFVVVETDFFF